MFLSSISILNIKITQSSLDKIKADVADYLQSNKNTQPLTIFTPNPEMVVEAQKNPAFRNILNTADINLPDGAGIVFALRILKFQISNFKFQIQRIAGIDFMEDLIKLAAEKGYPVALIGGRENTAEQALQNLQKKYPGLKGSVETPGEFKLSNNQINTNYPISNNNSIDLSLSSSPLKLIQNTLGIEDYIKKLSQRIKETGVKMVFVGLGAPKQEYFIDNIKYSGEARSRSARQISNFQFPIIFMSVGGALDVFAGKVRRAPLVMRNLGLEWLWRLLNEPWRIKRQWSLLKFVWLVLWEKV